MGCYVSRRVTVTQLPPEQLEDKEEAKSQTENCSLAGTEAVPSQDEAAEPKGTSKDRAKLEDETSEGDLPEELPEKLTSPQESSNVQSTGTLLISEGISRSQPSQETEMQKSSDILEELRMQGIIKSQSTTEGMYEYKGLALENTLKKPRARLEEIQFGDNEVGDFTVKEKMISGEDKKQVRENELNRMLQHNNFFPATEQQTTDILTENDCPRFGIQGDTDTPQLSPSDEELGYC
nr:stathmin domain-containing protein 1 [Columba livia]